MRLANWHKDHCVRDGQGGFERYRAGADLSTTGWDLWQSTRGCWVIRPDSNAIAAFRLGHFLALYSGVTWSGLIEKRRHVLTGYQVTDRGRLDPASGRLLGNASDDEQSALAYFTQHRLDMPNGAAAPVIKFF